MADYRRLGTAWRSLRLRTDACSAEALHFPDFSARGTAHRPGRLRKAGGERGYKSAACVDATGNLEPEPARTIDSAVWSIRSGRESSFDRRACGTLTKDRYRHANPAHGGNPVSRAPRFYHQRHFWGSSSGAADLLHNHLHVHGGKSAAATAAGGANDTVSR